MFPIGYVERCNGDGMKLVDITELVVAEEGSGYGMKSKGGGSGKQCSS